MNTNQTPEPAHEDPFDENAPRHRSGYPVDEPGRPDTDRPDTDPDRRRRDSDPDGDRDDGDGDADGDDGDGGAGDGEPAGTGG